MFPPVERADEDGLLCWGGDLKPQTLVAAYQNGIFPWPHRDLPLLWFAPPQRAILQFDELHLNTRLKRTLRNSGFEIRFDSAFSQVMRACAAPRWYEGEWEPNTWIWPEVIESYERLHQMGHAHSVECWQNGELVGGLYGVNFGAYFGGESMFHLVPNASKAAVVALCEKLRENGASWLDCQMMTPHFAALGAKEIARRDYSKRLKCALQKPKAFGNL